MHTTIQHTKNNVPVKITRIEEYDSPKSAWIVHMILAEVDNEFAGYLKISYMPQERFEQHYPDIIHFIAKKKGWSSLKTALEMEDLALIIRELDVYNDYKHPITELEPQIQAIENLTAKLQSVYQEEYKGFKEYHMNRPQIDMVRVYDENDEWVFGHTSKKSIQRINKRDFKNQGIGTLLYNEGIEWMAEKNLYLHASNTQTADAIRMWSKLEKIACIKEFIPDTTNKEYKLPRNYVEHLYPKVELSP